MFVTRLMLRGEIIDNADITLSAYSGLPFNDVYCASKFAVEGACESLAILLQHFNIQ